MAGALDDIVVLDLSRILAGPTCTQLMGDLGATVWKIENPGTGGDDTRSWGPPHLHNADGSRSDLSTYFMCANRNKKSVAIDFNDATDLAMVQALAARADVVIENFKPGGLKPYGLDHDSLCARHPGLIYCSISGFGQTGPNRDKPGYDLMAQGFGGIMSLTGEPDGQPMKVAVGIADVMCGMYATVGILAALHHRQKTGRGQHIDLALVDTQMAWLINAGTGYLNTGRDPVRRGNGHPNIAPYDVFATRDGHVIVAVGNDPQYRRFCDFLGRPDLAERPDFATNPARLEHRAALTAALAPLLGAMTTESVISGLEALKVPVGPVNQLSEALNGDQARARDMVVEFDAPELSERKQRLLGNPLKLSETPITYRFSPPHVGADSDEFSRLFQIDENDG